LPETSPAICWLAENAMLPTEKREIWAASKEVTALLTSAGRDDPHKLGSVRTVTLPKWPPAS